MRPCRLEVEEALGVDLGEALRPPGLGEVATGERGALAAVVPAANAATSTGRVSAGRSSMRSSSATGAVYVREPFRKPPAAAEERRERDDPTHTVTLRPDVDEHEPPGEVRWYWTAPIRIWTPTNPEHAEGQHRRRGAEERRETR